MAKGKVYAVGFGPGGHDHMTVKAVNVIKNADIVTGYTTYVEMLRTTSQIKNTNQLR